MLVLLIASVGCHLALQGFGLVFFGAEGQRGPALSNAVFTVDPLRFTGQSIAVYAITVALIAGLWLFFGFTLTGKALRATAVNRLGARLVGIRTALSGQIAFLLASVIGAISGILIVPITTLYYDTGFLIGLKGFVAAIIGGLVSYPLTALAALLVGGVEAFSSFYASNFKEVIVFTLIIPVLVVAVAGSARGRGREGLIAMGQRLPIILFALVMAVIPFIPGMPPFWIVLLDNIGLVRAGGDGTCAAHRRRRSDIVWPGGVLRLRRLHHGGADDDLWPLAMADAAALALVSGIAAVALGLVTVRLSGHYLPLGTIAWGLGLFYLFSKLEFLGRNDGISGIPPLAIGSLQDDRSRNDLFRDLDRGPALRAAHHEPAGLAHRTRHPRVAARTCRRRGVRHPDAARQASGLHLRGRAGRTVRLALCAFPARRQSYPVRRTGRHRISLHRGGRRRRLCLGRRIGRRDRRHPEGNSSELFAAYLFHGEGQLETIVFGILLVLLLQLAPAGVWPWLIAPRAVQASPQAA